VRILNDGRGILVSAVSVRVKKPEGGTRKLISPGSKYED